MFSLQSARYTKNIQIFDVNKILELILLPY